MLTAGVAKYDRGTETTTEQNSEFEDNLGGTWNWDGNEQGYQRVRLETRQNGEAKEESGCEMEKCRKWLR